MLAIFQEQFYWKVIILAFLIRIFLMPFYYHPDIKTYHFQSSFLKTGAWNIYSYLDSHKNELPLKEEFVYFPLAYFFLGSYQILISPLLGNNFYNWLYDASAQSSQTAEIFRYLFILKFPYLIFDFLIAFLLTSFFSEERKKRMVFTLWLFNPFSIILIYFYSNIDIIPVTLVLLSLLSLKNKQYLFSGILLGIGAGFKAYPLLLLPFLIFIGEKLKDKLIIFMAALITAALIILPFLASTQFRQAALVSGLTTRIFIPSISLGFNENIILPIVMLAIIFFLVLSKRRINIEQSIICCFVVLLIIFSSIHFHIQWLLWMLPFAIWVLIVYQPMRLLIVVLLCLAFIIPLIYNDKSMTVSLLQTISPYYNLLPTPFMIIQKFYDPYSIQSILHSIFLAGSLVIIWKLAKEL